MKTEIATLGEARNHALCACISQAEATSRNAPEVPVKKLALIPVAAGALFAAATMPATAQGFGFPILGPFYSADPYYDYYRHARSPYYRYYDYAPGSEWDGREWRRQPFHTPPIADGPAGKRRGAAAAEK